MLSHRLKGEKIDYIYSSDLPSAVETAKYIANNHGKPIVTDSRLREQHMGGLTGQSWSDAKKRLHRVDLNLNQMLAKDGEPLLSLKERVIAFYIDLVERHLLNPNQVELDRPPNSDKNMLEQELGPVTPSTPIAPAPTPVGNEPARRVPTTKSCTVILVTHGGPIKVLTEHFLEELGFSLPKSHLPIVGPTKKATKTLERRTPTPHPPAGTQSIPLTSQYPRSGSLTLCTLQRRYSSQTDEYDWKGALVLWNCVAHMAKASFFDIVYPQVQSHPEGNAPVKQSSNKSSSIKLQITKNVALPFLKKISPPKSPISEEVTPQTTSAAIGEYRMFSKDYAAGPPAAPIISQQPAGDKRLRSLGW
jgi:broad specificity phosphatase PhoE